MNDNAPSVEPMSVEVWRHRRRIHRARLLAGCVYQGYAMTHNPAFAWFFIPPAWAVPEDSPMRAIYDTMRRKAHA